MKIFLTSSLGSSYMEEGIRKPSALDARNGLVRTLRGVWPDRANCLIISSDPENDEMNDSFREIYAQSFQMTGLDLKGMEVCDNRNEQDIAGLIQWSDVVVLAGGHVPTENSFFMRLDLKGHLENYGGLVIGISAGTMNCADVVYAQPELDGEATDPSYRRYIPGLGLTTINVLPHFQELEGLILDGFNVIEEIAVPDSCERPFYGLPDGSYIVVEDGKAVLYGEGYYFDRGIKRKVCAAEASMTLGW